MTREDFMLEGGTITEDSIHTIPSQEELVLQVRLTPALRAGRKDGTGWYEAHVVEDGYAYRAPNAEADAEWQWARSADFERVHEAWEITDTNMIIESMTVALKKVMQLDSALRLAFNCMGRASKRRYEKACQRTRR